LAGPESSVVGRILPVLHAQDSRRVRDSEQWVREFRLQASADHRVVRVLRRAARDSVISKVRKKDR
jgi:hypothetical protein